MVIVSVGRPGVGRLLSRLLAHPDPAVAAGVFTAMQSMVKLDAAAVERAAALYEAPYTNPRRG